MCENQTLDHTGDKKYLGTRNWTWPNHIISL